MSTIPSKRVLGVLAFISLVCLFVLSSWGRQATLMAQEPDGEKADDGTAVTEQMRRFLEDQGQPVENVVAAAASPCIGGMADIYPCNSIDLLAHIPLATMGATAGNTGWGWTDPLDGTEYAIMGLNNGTAFVDISDPENPIYLGKLPTHAGSSSWREFKVAGDHVYIVSDSNPGHGMQVFDLTELRDVVSPPVTFSETAHYAGITGNVVSSAHNIAANDDTDFVYIVGSGSCSAGLHMVNVQTPASPTFAGCFSADGYTHDTQCVIYNGPDTDHQGDEICLNSNEDTLTIVDVTNKSLPVQLSRTPYAGSGYTHQGWLTEDQHYFLLDDELDETGNGHNTRTYIWDVSNLEAPVMMDYYEAAVPAIDHNQYILGNYVYQSNYRSGLRILDISDVANANLAEVAFFDTYPADDSPNFSGTWNNYPYFESGVVVISDINSGLFLVRPHLTSFNLSVEPTSLDVCQGTDAVYIVTVTESGSTDPVTLSAVGVPAGANHSFSVNPVTPTGTSVLSITNTAVVTPGSYDIDVVGSNLTDTITSTIGLIISTNVTGTPTLISPADGAGGIGTSPVLEWTAVPGAVNYYVEIADDAGFTNIVYTATETSTSHTVGLSLNTDTTYYWRVTASNACGDGNASTPFSFTTGDLVCVTYDSLDVPVAIPDIGTATSDLTVADAGTIVDVNVLNIVGTHTYVSDLEFYLESPLNTVVQLHGSACGDDDNFDINYDDEAAPGDPPCPPTDGGTYQPVQPLSAFDNENPAGEWTFRIEDVFAQDSGQLTSWSVEICRIPQAVAPPEIAVEPASLEVAQTTEITVTYPLSITNNGEDDLTWDIFEDATGFGPTGGWSDNFDSYATGSQMHGQGGWKGWFNDPNAGAIVTDAVSVSTPNAVEIVGSSDLVHEFSGYITDTWTMTAWQYVPGDMVGLSYFILLNSYDDGGVDMNWSTQVTFNNSSDLVNNEGISGGTLPLLTDQWVEIRVEIDLSNNTQEFYYGGQLLYAGTWTEELSGGGDLNIEAIDLYANGASAVYYDDISLVAPLPPITICDAPSDIPWLEVSPTAGTTLSGTTSVVDVTVDSTGLPFGVYTGTLCVNSNDPVTAQVQVPVTLTVETAPAISLVKTVGTDPNSCASSSTITITTTTTVYYCYEVTNTGNITLTLHDLEDSELGPLFSGLAYNLAPGASVDTVVAGQTISATISATTVNTATWTAYNAGPIEVATAVASATVNFSSPPPDDQFFIYLPVILKPDGD